MNREKIIHKAEQTAQKLRRRLRSSDALVSDPLIKEAHTAIVSLLGLLEGAKDGKENT